MLDRKRTLKNILESSDVNSNDHIITNLLRVYVGELIQELFVINTSVRDIWEILCETLKTSNGIDKSRRATISQESVQK